MSSSNNSDPPNYEQLLVDPASEDPAVQALRAQLRAAEAEARRKAEQDARCSKEEERRHWEVEARVRAETEARRRALAEQERKLREAETKAKRMVDLDEAR